MIAEGHKIANALMFFWEVLGELHKGAFQGYFKGAQPFLTPKLS
jgi:hypothetical protein